MRYVEQLRRYHERFGRERVLVLIYDDFREDNAGTVRKVLRFLDVDEDAPVVIGHANPSVRMRSQQLDELVNCRLDGSGPATRALKGAIKAVVPREPPAGCPEGHAAPSRARRAGRLPTLR